MKDKNGQEIQHKPLLPLMWVVQIHETFFNPLLYDGSNIQFIKDQYRTNELGFFIGVSFSLAVAQVFLAARRRSLLLQKKRFIFNQYKKNKFLEG